jgi:LPS-assembly lipoprotein
MDFIRRFGMPNPYGSILARTALLVAMTILLVSCGFHLRGMQEMPTHLKTMAVLPDNPYEPLQRDIRRALRQAHINVVPSPTGVYSLHIDHAALTRSIMIIGKDGQAKQEELIYTLVYTVKAPHADLMPPQTIKVQRILNVDYNRTLGQDLEENILVNEMQSEVTAQLMRRLSVIKP